MNAQPEALAGQNYCYNSRSYMRTAPDTGSPIPELHLDTAAMVRDGQLPLLSRFTPINQPREERNVEVAVEDDTTMQDDEECARAAAERTRGEKRKRCESILRSLPVLTDTNRAAVRQLEPWCDEWCYFEEADGLIP